LITAKKVLLRWSNDNNFYRKLIIRGHYVTLLSYLD
jgi:hypothetical protein